jgi:branched-chain amino acid transport system substrate-binding protein
MAHHTAFRAVAAAAAAALLLAGCGDSGDTDDDAGAAPTAEATEEPTEEECVAPVAEPAAEPSTAPLKIGSVLPETGSLAFLGPPEFAGVDLAVEDINEAGGVLDQPVEHVRGDSGDETTDTANGTVDRLLGEDVQVIIGAAASAVTRLIIDKVTTAGVVQISPANTADDFTCYDDGGFYFRTAPPDRLQGPAVGQVMANDGIQRAAILARNDPYGTGLADNIEATLIDAGVPQDQILKIIYDPNAQSFNTEIDQVVEFDPDGVALIGFDESGRILTRMSEVGIGPTDLPVYGTDGNVGNALGEGLPEGILAGMKGTTPLTDLADDFTNALLEIDPDLEDFNYAAESYDAVTIAAIAAELGQSTAPADIASRLNDITRPGGEECDSFATCKEAIAGGAEQVTYDGVIGVLNFSDAGEPQAASYGVLQFGENNQIDNELTEFVFIEGDA